MFLLLHLACRAPAGGEQPDESSVVTGDSDSASTGDTGDSVPFSCGTLPDAPPLSSTTWSPTATVTAGGIDSITSAPTGYPVYVGGMSTGAWRADDPGLTWQELHVDKTHTWAEIAIDADNPAEIFHSTGGVLWRSRDGGGTFVQLPLGDVTNPDDVQLVLALAMSHGNLWAVLSNGTAAWSGDHGETWEMRGSLGTRYSFGAHWLRVLPPEDGGEGAVFFTDGTDLYRSRDGMRTWQPLRPDVAGGYSLARAGTTLYVGTAGGYATSTDEGDTWTETNPGFAVAHVTVTPGGEVALAANTSLVVGAGPTRTLPAAVEFLGHVGERLLLGTADGVLASDDLGVTWTPEREGMVDEGFSVVAPHPQCPNRVLLGSRCSGGAYRTVDYGNSWLPVTTYFHYVMGYHFDLRVPDRVWGVTDDQLLRSDDGGVNWDPVTQSAHFHAFAQDPTDPDTLLLGSVGSGTYADDEMTVYRSEDGGAVWTRSSDGLPSGSTASAHVLLFAPDDPSVVLLGTYKGDVSHDQGSGIGLFRSTDGGSTWAAGTLRELDVPALVASGDTLWAGTGTGLYASTDDGETWTRNPSISGAVLSVAFHGDLGLAYLYAGEVWRSDDAGATWYRFNDGAGGFTATSLAQVGIATDGSMAWLANYGHAVVRIGLDATP
jgi:photosystem II stability/assembly factor-like uncharacterized protein